MIKFRTLITLSAAMSGVLLAGCAQNPYRQGGFMCNNTGACADDKPAQSAPLPPPSQEGCIGNDFRQCLLGLRRYVDVGQNELNSIEQQVVRNNDLDVNGKPVYTSKKLSFLGGGKHFYDATKFFIIYNEQNIVTDAGFDIQQVPTLAKTTNDFERTDLYEATHALFGAQCSELSKDSLYSFFYNSITAKMHVEHEATKLSGDALNEKWHRSSQGAPYCGFSVEYAGEDFQHTTGSGRQEGRTSNIVLYSAPKKK